MSEELQFDPEEKTFSSLEAVQDEYPHIRHCFDRLYVPVFPVRNQPSAFDKVSFDVAVFELKEFWSDRSEKKTHYRFVRV